MKLKIKPLNLYLLISLATILTGMVWMALTKGNVWDSLLFGDHDDYFMDFFNHIFYVNDPAILYTRSVQASFPAFAYLLYYFFNRLIPAEFTITPWDARDNQYGYMVFYMYSVLAVMFLTMMVKKHLEGTKVNAGLVLITVCLTGPFLYMLERGNAVLLVIGLLLAFLYFRESEIAWKKELALVFLAFAAGFKLYPAVFGMLYLKEKRYGEAFRAVLYGILVFTVPFAFFGGMEGFQTFLGNITYVNNMVWEEGCFNSITYFVMMFGYRLGAATSVSIWIGKLCSALFFLAVIILVWRSKSKWRSAALLTGTMILFPMWSGTYTVAYMCIPLVLFLREKEDGYEVLDYVYAALFAGIFSLIVAFSKFTMEYLFSTLTIVVRYISLYLMMGILLIQEITIWIRKK